MSAQLNYLRLNHAYAFQSSDTPETAPKHLLMTAAILTREGFITLEELYPHVGVTRSNLQSTEST